jgi:hypothetical protein
MKRWIFLGLSGVLYAPFLMCVMIAGYQWDKGSIWPWLLAGFCLDFASNFFCRLAEPGKHGSQPARGVSIGG